MRPAHDTLDHQNLSAPPARPNRRLFVRRPQPPFFEKIDCSTSKYCMDNHHDDERYVSICKLMNPSDPARGADPATRSFRWALAEQRLPEMAAEAQERVRVSKRLGSPEF